MAKIHYIIISLHALLTYIQRMHYITAKPCQTTAQESTTHHKITLHRVRSKFPYIVLLTQKTTTQRGNIKRPTRRACDATRRDATPHDTTKQHKTRHIQNPPSEPIQIPWPEGLFDQDQIHFSILVPVNHQRPPEERAICRYTQQRAVIHQPELALCVLAEVAHGVRQVDNQKVQSAILIPVSHAQVPAHFNITNAQEGVLLQGAVCWMNIDNQLYIQHKKHMFFDVLKYICVWILSVYICISIIYAFFWNLPIYLSIYLSAYLSPNYIKLWHLLTPLLSSFFFKASNVLIVLHPNIICKKHIQLAIAIDVKNFGQTHEFMFDIFERTGFFLHKISWISLLKQVQACQGVQFGQFQFEIMFLLTSLIFGRQEPYVLATGRIN